MFSTLKTRLLLGVYIFIILSIPVGAYLASQNQTYKSKASETKPTKVTKSTPKPSINPLPAPAKELLSVLEDNVAENTTPVIPQEEATSSPTIATSFGPTLSLKISLEGRPVSKQATKLFVGIMEGQLTSNPKFLLSFSVNLENNGAYSNLSLAGLSAGTKYTALLKGKTQIATSSAFIMFPTVTNLNNGQDLNMLSGDLNEDNAVTAADLSIAQSGNKLADFNQDGIINSFDFAIIIKNLGQVGASGAWTSPLPKVATPSGNLATQDHLSATGGYWIWIPR